ncbi:U4/U6 small nuclear ribonucleoprotein PRP31 [Angomonas deanei]|nr:U4/U6 small nuclear ribonucleoprotein PRP31 [Angomonas deanei]|eukprot:EPY37418.1 U4/U6 small nuclear ribonucleoprotein PRP31 [Angomonas deanei]
MEEGWNESSEKGKDALNINDIEQINLTDEDALLYDSVTQVTKLLRSSYLSDMFRKLSDFHQVSSNKNAITPDDPEYSYVSECSALVLRIEAEKSRAAVFLRSHYAQRFPELIMFFSNTVAYAKVVSIIMNNMDFSNVIEELEPLIPSQMLVVIIACASTTLGRELEVVECERIQEACREIENLETAKQTFLEYIQCSMPLVCPNVCAFLGTAITSQIFAIVGSVNRIALLDPSDLVKLGSTRGVQSGIDVKTTGFLSNVDLVENLKPELRPKALRSISSSVVKLARIDTNKRAPTNEEGVKERQFVMKRIRRWLDPVVVTGAGNNMYTRVNRRRKRRRG